MRSSRGLDSPPHRFEALDGLRGLAALLVVLFHVRWPNHLTSNAFVNHGYLAVDLFFILSGFIMSANYAGRLTTSEQRADFIARRFFRVYPLHLVVLVAFVAVDLLKLGASRGGFSAHHTPFAGDHGVGLLVANLFLVQGVGLVQSLSWNHPSWSISCEFAAYALFAATASSFPFHDLRRCAWWAGTACVLYAGLAYAHGSLDVVGAAGVARCLLGFLLGMIVFAWTSPPAMRARLAHVPGLVSIAQGALLGAVVLVMTVGTGWRVVFVIPLFVAMIAVYQVDDGVCARVLRSSRCLALGRLSYSVYMVHFLVLACLSSMTTRALARADVSRDISSPMLGLDPWRGDVLVIALIVIVLVVARVTFQVVEQPGRLFGRRWMASRRPRPWRESRLGVPRGS